MDDLVPGVWQCTEEEYLADTSYIASTMLKTFADPSEGSLAYAESYVYQTKQPSASSRDKVVGRALHARLEDEDAYYETHVASPVGSVSPRSNKDTEQLTKFVLANPGKTVLSTAEFAMVAGMAAAIYENPHMAETLLLDHETELAIRWIDKESGVPCKCKLDWFNRELPRIIDYKSSINPGAGFGKDAFNYMYHLSAVHYISGVKHVFPELGITPSAWEWFVVGKQSPHETHVYYLDGEELAAATRLYRHTLLELAGCYEYNDFLPANYGTPEPLRFPRWAFSQ